MISRAGRSRTENTILCCALPCTVLVLILRLLYKRSQSKEDQSCSGLASFHSLASIELELDISINIDTYAHRQTRHLETTIDNHRSWNAPSPASIPLHRMSSPSPSPRDCVYLHIRFIHTSTKYANITPRRSVSVSVTSCTSFNHTI